MEHLQMPRITVAATDAADAEAAPPLWAATDLGDGVLAVGRGGVLRVMTAGNPRRVACRAVRPVRQ